jgi:hypothetical protein
MSRPLSLFLGLLCFPFHLGKRYSIELGDDTYNCRRDDGIIMLRADGGVVVLKTWSEGPVVWSSTYNTVYCPYFSLSLSLLFFPLLISGLGQ